MIPPVVGGEGLVFDFQTFYKFFGGGVTSDL